VGEFRSGLEEYAFMKRLISFLLLVRDGQPVMQTVFDITRAANYETVNRELVGQQLAKGGFRLAKLLDAIYRE
jgi:hypothetical protein